MTNFLVEHLRFLSVGWILEQRTPYFWKNEKNLCTNLKSGEHVANAHCYQQAHTPASEASVGAAPCQKSPFFPRKGVTIFVTHWAQKSTLPFLPLLYWVSSKFWCYVTIFVTHWAQKSHLAFSPSPILSQLKNQLLCDNFCNIRHKNFPCFFFFLYIECQLKICSHVTIFATLGTKKSPCFIVAMLSQLKIWDKIWDKTSSFLYLISTAWNYLKSRPSAA